MFKKKSRKWFMLSSVIILGIIGMGFTVYEMSNSNKNDTNFNDPKESSQTDVHIQNEDETEVVPIEITQENIQNHIDINMAQNRIIDLIGRPTDSFYKTGRNIWRYDVIKSEGYKRKPDSVDRVDFEGLKDGDIKMQLFLSWNHDNTIEKVVSYFHENGKLMEYELLDEVTINELNEDDYFRIHIGDPEKLLSPNEVKNIVNAIKKPELLSKELLESGDQDKIIQRLVDVNSWHSKIFGVFDRIYFGNDAKVEIINLLNQYYTENYSESLFSWNFMENGNYYTLRPSDFFPSLISIQHDDDLIFEIHQNSDNYEIEVISPSYGGIVYAEEIVTFKYLIDKTNYLIGS